MSRKPSSTEKLAQAAVRAKEGGRSKDPKPARKTAFASRTSLVADAVAGSASYADQRLVDPNQCRLWTNHNRDPARS